MTALRVTISAGGSRITDEQGVAKGGAAFVGVATDRAGDWPVPKGWTATAQSGEHRIQRPGGVAFRVREALSAFADPSLPGTVEELGRYVFELLGGADLLAAMGAGHDPVALTVEAADAMASLPWELARADAGWIALGERPIVVTRPVAPVAGSVPTAFERPLKVLFVVGCDVHDRQIEPAMEIVSVLRQDLDSDGMDVVVSWVLDASLESIEEEVKRFGPHVVHVVAHGRGTEGGVVELRDVDRAKLDPVPVDAKGLFAALRHRLPPVVVVNACDSGGAGTRGVGSAANAPFGLALARLGVPQVVAMNGRIADAAARPFTRVFYRALVAGLPVGQAVAKARVSGVALNVTGAVDWARPVLFGADPEVPPPKSRGPAFELLQKEYRGTFRGPHGFCGHLDAVSRWQAMLAATASPAEALLPIRVQQGQIFPGQFGRTWLLRHLGLHALARGHFPLYVDLREPRPDLPPEAKGRRVLATRLLERARAWLGQLELGVKVPDALDLVFEAVGPPGEEDELDKDAAAALVQALPGFDPEPLKTVRNSATKEERPWKLAEAALDQAIPLFFRALQARLPRPLVVLLDNVEEPIDEGRALLDTLKRTGRFAGLGSTGDRVLTAFTVDERAASRGNADFKRDFAATGKALPEPVELGPWPVARWRSIGQGYLLSVRELQQQKVSGYVVNPDARGALSSLGIASNLTPSRLPEGLQTVFEFEGPDAFSLVRDEDLLRG